MPPNPERTEETRVRIIETAERLFALHGIEGVSTRQIVVESGQKNNSAVTYHFGTSKALIRAIFKHRSAVIDADRAKLIAAMNNGAGVQSLEDLVVAIVAPVVRFMATQSPSYYMRFTREAMQAMGRPALAATIAFVPAYRSVFMRGLMLLDHIPIPRKKNRLIMVAEFYVQQLASWERMATMQDPGSEEPVPTLTDFASDVIETSIGMLAAPEPKRSGLFHNILFGTKG
jgi:AcrR family transcriptional regulator